MERSKFVTHGATGLPIRMPPYLRREIARGDQSAKLQLDLIAGSKVIGERSFMDTIVTNFEQNVKLRKAARCASQRLAKTAVDLGAPRYFTFVHGSVARGLVRHQDSCDPSDVDIDLVVDGVDISDNSRQALRYRMKNLGKDLGTKLDSYVYTLDDLKRDSACYARMMLEAGSYPLADVGGLFEEARMYGLEALSFFELNRRARRRVKDFVAFSEQGNYETAFKVLEKDEDGRIAAVYIGRGNDGSLEGLASRIAFLKGFIDLNGGKANGGLYGS